MNMHEFLKEALENDALDLWVCLSNGTSLLVREVGALTPEWVDFNLPADHRNAVLSCRVADVTAVAW